MVTKRLCTEDGILNLTSPLPFSRLSLNTQVLAQGEQRYRDVTYGNLSLCESRVLRATNIIFDFLFSSSMIQEWNGNSCYIFYQ